MSRKIYHLFLIPILLTSCGTNPGTGHKEIQLISDKKEIHMGKKHYPYGQQSSGGVYTLDPELSVYVQEVGEKLAAQSNRPHLPYTFVVLNNSVPNSWAMPGGKIAINRGLLSQLKSESELAAVLSHEIAHATLRHSAQSTERAILMTTGLVAAYLMLYPDSNKNILLMGAAITSILIHTQHSRDAELEADHYGMLYMSRAGYHPQGAIDLQILFLEMQDKKSSNWLKGLFATHPPSKERLAANREFAQHLSGGFEGKHIYQEKIACLKKRGDAYKAYDNGVIALEQDNSEDALVFAEKAILYLPEESLFYQLKGDALSYQNRYKAAVEAYTIAIEKNPDYYYSYQKRGLLHKKWGDKNDARIDITQADILLPSELNKQTLDELEQRAGWSTAIIIGSAIEIGNSRRIEQRPRIVRRRVEPATNIPPGARISRRIERAPQTPPPPPGTRIARRIELISPPATAN
jgi:predicted Zn-dependent protease